MTEASDQNQNTYVIDDKSGAEMARLLDQDRLMTREMGGLFPEREDLAGISRILDVACGPGGWTQEVAFAHPEIDVVGVDISSAMIEHARAQAKMQRLENVRFEIVDARKPLPFPDGSFDLINARLIVGFMLPSAWPALMSEYLRLLRPGGVLRLTEGEWAWTTSPAFERLQLLFTRALYESGQSFSPTGAHLGITPVLNRIMRNAGFTHIQSKAHGVDISSGTQAHQGYFNDVRSAFPLVHPFLQKWVGTTKEEMQSLHQEALTEMLADDFCGLWFIYTIWGEKV